MTSEQATFLKAACDLAGGECTIRQYNTHTHAIVIDNEADLLPAVVAYLAFALEVVRCDRTAVFVVPKMEPLRRDNMGRSVVLY